jgi:GT2 family glycosyltransferase
MAKDNLLSLSSADVAFRATASQVFDVGAVVVTYNRKRLLLQTLEKLEAQTYRIARIIIVDNCSTDGTRELLRELGNNPRIEPIFLPSNTGGAGGFAAGIELAYQLGHELIWIMDDDVLPNSDALEQLMKALVDLRKDGVEPNFLIPNIFNQEGEPVNTPVMDLRVQTNGNMHWPAFLEKNIVPVVACSFVGTLIAREAVAAYGLPVAEMFIWGDDTEYTFRLSRDRESGYIVGLSRFVHVGRPVELSIITTTDMRRIRNFFYFYRNNVYVLRKYGTKQARAAFALRAARDTRRLLVAGRIRSVMIVLHGIMRGFFFNPPLRRPQ